MPGDHVVVIEPVGVHHDIEVDELPVVEVRQVLAVDLGDARFRVVLHQVHDLVPELEGGHFLVVPDLHEFPQAGEDLTRREPRGGLRLHGPVGLELLHHVGGDGDVALVVLADVPLSPELFQVAVVHEELQVLHPEEGGHVVAVDPVAGRLLDHCREDEHLHRLQSEHALEQSDLAGGPLGRQGSNLDLVRSRRITHLLGDLVHAFDNRLSHTLSFKRYKGQASVCQKAAVKELSAKKWQRGERKSAAAHSFRAVQS